jgi:hypothetical protein
MKNLIVRRSLTAIMFIIGMSKFCYSQNLPKALIIDSRVGASVDTLEKEKYQLFPEFSSEVFKGAMFMEMPDKSLEQWIYLKDGTIDKQPITKERYSELKKAIRNTATESKGYSNAVFTVKPGFNLNGANIGFKKGRIEPYFGLQFVSYNSKYKYDSNNQFDDDYESQTKLHVYMPYIGSKFYMLDNESLKTSINVTLFKPFIFGKQIVDGSEDSDFKENLKNIKIYGAELGFGSEYFLSKNFSIGGEFGFRLAYLKDDYTSPDSDYSYTDILKLNMSYISASLNYYFIK